MDTMFILWRASYADLLAVETDAILEVVVVEHGSV